MSKQYKLKLVDGNYAFTFKKPHGFQIMDGSSSSSGWSSDRFELFYTEKHQQEVVFTKETRGELMRYKRRGDSALLPEKVLPENVDQLVEELRLEGISELYESVYGEPTVERVVVRLAEFEDLPEVRSAQRPASRAPRGMRWKTYADYLPFGAVYDGLLPGYFEGYSKALAEELSEMLNRRAGFQIWTHKADHGSIEGYREVKITKDLASPFHTSPKTVNADFRYEVGKTLRGECLEDAVQKFTAEVERIYAEITRPLVLSIAEKAAA